MPTTRLSLGKHWDAFIASEVSCGRYASPSEVVRDALRQLEERHRALDALRVHLAEGEAEARRGETNGQMAMDVNQRGYDVVSAAGERISVKTTAQSGYEGSVSFNPNSLDLMESECLIAESHEVHRGC